jgi:hypothetical protein
MAHIAKHRWWWDAAGFLIAAVGVAVLVYAVVYLSWGCFHRTQSSPLAYMLSCPVDQHPSRIVDLVQRSAQG